jgi:hypothetical protein
MSRRSFRSPTVHLVPGASWAKPGPALVAAGILSSCILSGCGGGAPAKPQVVTGDGWSFSAPAAWTPTDQGGATHGAVDVIEIRRFTLLKPYRHAILVRAVRELDGVASGLARQLAARITSSRTERLAGRDARTYTLAYGGKTQQITFVLDGRSEYELICRLAAGASDAPCRRLLATFALG